MVVRGATEGGELAVQCHPRHGHGAQDVPERRHLRCDACLPTRGLAVAVYLLLCAIIISAPVIVVAVRGERATPRMREGTEWLVFHSSTVGAAILIVVGVDPFVTAFP